MLTVRGFVGAEFAGRETGSDCEIAATNLSTIEMYVQISRRRSMYDVKSCFYCYVTNITMIPCQLFVWSQDLGITIENEYPARHERKLWYQRPTVSMGSRRGEVNPPSFEAPRLRIFLRGYHTYAKHQLSSSYNIILGCIKYTRLIFVFMRSIYRT